MSKEKWTPSFSKFVRGRSPMFNRPLFGYNVVCACGWSQRVNGTKAEAMKAFRDHKRRSHR